MESGEQAEPIEAPGSRRAPAAELLAALAALAVVARVVAQGMLDRRPRFTGAEASDLGNLMLHHFAVRDFETLARFWTPTDQFKPPLFYGGVPALLGFQESISYFDLLLFNVPALLLALWACWRLGREHSDAWAGLCCVASVALLPGVVGRTLLVGPDLWLMAAFGWSLYYFQQLLRPQSSVRSAVALGLVVGLGMLVKWTLALPLVGIVGVALVESASREEGKRQRKLLLLALAIAALLVLPWVVGLANLELFRAAAGSELSGASWLKMPPWIFLSVWTIRDGIGPFGAPLVVLAGVGALAAWRSGRGSREGRPRRTLVRMLLTSIAVVYMVHSLLPHKEVRYLQSALLSIGMLLGLGLGSFASSSVRARVAATAALVLLLMGSLLWPLRSQSNDSSYLQEDHIYLDLDRDDWGIEKLVLHPTITQHPAPLIGYFLRGPRYFELRDTVSWEFYARNDRPVRSIFPDWRSWDPAAMDEQLPPQLLDQFSAATHVVNDRPLSPRQTAQMAQLGFRLLLEMQLPFFQAEFLQFWEKN